jgi:stalled ribosome rescue protein Dom34
MSHFHAVVWLDHNEAHIMHISPDDVETSVVKPAEPHRNLQRKRGSVSGSRQPEDQHFYHEVVEAMSGAAEILIVGPGHAKLELIKHIHAHDPKIADKVIGVETVDHPSDAQVVAFARKYFVAKDRMLSQ